MNMPLVEAKSMPAAQPPADRRRKGFALPLALLAIAVLTVVLAASFTSTATEILTNNSQRSEARAFALAENGLQDFIAMRDRKSDPSNPQRYCYLCGSPPTTKYESTTVTLPGGYAQVVAQRVSKGRGMTRPAVYLIRSRGVDTSTRLSGALRSGAGAVNIKAERTVAQYAYWDLKVINILSGWTSLSGLGVNGNSANLIGSDNCGMDAAGVSGLAVPTGTYKGKTGLAQSTPPTPPILELGTPKQAQDAVSIDWPNIVNEKAVTPDYSITASQTLPSNAFSDPQRWPIIHVRGNGLGTSTFTAPTGQGLLIVDDNVTFSGGGTWKGIMLVGNHLTSNGTNNVLGAVVTGLNVKLGMIVGQDDVGNGTKLYQYDSCNVAAATAGIGHYRLFPNAWMDNFTTY